MAFWFDLNLDHEHTLSSSPYGEKGATWPQVSGGERAKHERLPVSLPPKTPAGHVPTRHSSWERLQLNRCAVQAVQWLQEVRVVEGQDLSLTARHDTYGISFQVMRRKHLPEIPC